MIIIMPFFRQKIKRLYQISLFCPYTIAQNVCVGGGRGVTKESL
jgi:hypothetical protein